MRRWMWMWTRHTRVAWLPGAVQCNNMRRRVLTGTPRGGCGLPLHRQMNDALGIYLPRGSNAHHGLVRVGTVDDCAGEDANLRRGRESVKGIRQLTRGVTHSADGNSDVSARAIVWCAAASRHTSRTSTVGVRLEKLLPVKRTMNPPTAAATAPSSGCDHSQGGGSEEGGGEREKAGGGGASRRPKIHHTSLVK
jgi:hypothetical protein